MASYPRALPRSVDQLVEELDQAVSPAKIDGPEITEADPTDPTSTAPGPRGASGV